MTMIQPQEIRFTQADYLRKARELAGLTQQELADEIGIDRASVINYEKRGTPKMYILKAWAAATGFGLEQFTETKPSDYKATLVRAEKLIAPRRSRPQNRTGNTRPKGRA